MTFGPNEVRRCTLVNEDKCSLRTRDERIVKMPKTETGTAIAQDIQPLTQLKAWNALKTHHEQVGALHLRDLFAADPKRGDKFSVEALGLFFDYSKNRMNGETIKLLIELARESGLQSRIDA